MPKQKKKIVQRKKPELKAFLISKLRAASRRWPPIYECKNRQKRYVTIEVMPNCVRVFPDDWKSAYFEIPLYKNARNGRRTMFVCEHCGDWCFDKTWEQASTGRWIKKSGCDLDHVNPIVDPEKGFESWDVYIDRLFNGEMQVLCKPCHKKKSMEENASRVERRRNERRTSNEKTSKGPKKGSRSKRTD